MNYTYPTIQSVYEGTVFIMSGTFDSERYATYVIQHQYKGKLVVGYIFHDELEAYLEKGVCVRKNKVAFASGAEYINIPISCLKTSMQGRLNFSRNSSTQQL